MSVSLLELSVYTETLLELFMCSFNERQTPSMFVKSKSKVSCNYSRDILCVPSQFTFVVEYMFVLNCIVAERTMCSFDVKTCSSWVLAKTFNTGREHIFAISFLVGEYHVARCFMCSELYKLLPEKRSCSLHNRSLLEQRMFALIFLSK